MSKAHLCKVWKWSRGWFFSLDFQLFQYHSSKRWSSLSWIAFVTLPNVNWAYIHVDQFLSFCSFGLYIYSTNTTEARCQQGYLLKAPEENLSLAFLRFWYLLAFFGLWMHYSTVCFHCRIFFSTSVTKIPYASLLWRYLCLNLVTTWIIQETLSNSISLT